MQSEFKSQLNFVKINELSSKINKYSKKQHGDTVGDTLIQILGITERGIKSSRSSADTQKVAGQPGLIETLCSH